MDPVAAKAAYLRGLTDLVTVTRGTTTVAGVRARVIEATPDPLPGGLAQIGRRAILYADDLIAGGIILPLIANDRVVWNGRTMAVNAGDDATRRIGEVTIAVDVGLMGG